MNQTFSNSILNLNIKSSLQPVLDHYLFENTSLAMINYHFDEQYYNFNKNFTLHKFSDLNKSTYLSAFRNDIEYFIIFNKKLNKEHYKIIHNILVNDRTIILVECEFDRKKLQEEIGRYEFFKIDRIELKEKIKLF